VALSTAPERVSAQSQFAPNTPFQEDVVLNQLPPAAGVAFAPDGRIFLAIKDGAIRVAVNGTLLAKPFLDISGMVNRSTDRGLLTVAVDPEFPTRPYVYFAFVYDPPGLTSDVGEPRAVRVARVTADAAQDYNVALPDSMEIILGKNSTAENMAPPVPAEDPDTPERASCMTGLRMDGVPIDDCMPVDGLSHSAGTLLFAADGTLYASFGDGTKYDGPHAAGLRTQNLDSLAGKIVRIDPNTGAGVPGNPFYDPAKPNSNRSRVWAMAFEIPL
jgi:glucose/arabinose dehydrogenase